MLDTKGIPATMGGGKTVRIVSAQHIAKASVRYSKWQRAKDAAHWLEGAVQVRPTLTLSAEVFGISVPSVIRARKRIAQAQQGKRHGNGGTTPLSDFAVENIVREVGVDRIWRAVDKITQPKLPLVAAE